MSHKQSSILFTFLALVCIAAVVGSVYTPVQARSIQPNGTKNTCTSCHENLYFLHDTGKWFCLRESPMQCVDCHGGNPEAIKKEDAHLKRAEHPIINEDISKCQECHPEKSAERIELFDQRAGISQVLVAMPYTRMYVTESGGTTTADLPQEPNPLIGYAEFLPLILVSGLALVIYFVSHRRHNE
ncbi:MAG TPA: hypothetical protein VFY25_03990 [Anaerolineales bacterium]|nr:hypothetical protein [Anaerolineales bacterium]